MDASELTMAFARLEGQFEARSPQAICRVMDSLPVLHALRTQHILDGAGEMIEPSDYVLLRNVLLQIEIKMRLASLVCSKQMSVTGLTIPSSRAG